MSELVAMYPELIGEMAKRRLTQTSVAKEIGISSRTLYSKLSGKTAFTLSEANLSHAAFFQDMDKEFLFSRAEQDRV